MKANELMIGDLVKFPIGTEKIVDLLYIAGRGICASFAASATLFPVEVAKLEPIPLTPEILEKNGFEKNEFSLFMYPLIDGVVRFDKHQYGLYCNILRPFSRYDAVCNYVHQLQHALRLCGIDKEIEL